MSASAWEKIIGSVFEWDTAKEEKLRALWAEGLSTAAIGARIGCNKNQVIGKARRLLLPPRPSPLPEKAQRPNPRPPRPPELRVTTPAQAKRLAPHEPVVPLRTPRVPAALRLPIPIGALPPARCCQWTDSTRRPWLFCDAPTVAGFSWCAEHKGRVFHSAAA